MAKRHLIVGAGTAGINAIRALRQLGNTDEIILVSAEPPYSRMVLPYYLEQGISEAHATTVTPLQLEKWEVQTHFGRRAVSLDTQANTLKLDNDEEIAYDDLLIATGSSASRLPVPGADGEGVFTFWTMEDAQALHRQIHPEAHVVMIGAGFISFTILNGIIKRANKVTIVEVAERILPRMIDDQGATLMADWLREKGVEMRTGVKVTEIGPGAKKKLSLDDGGTLEADLVVMATGIRTNLEWLDGSGITINQGIVVDENLRSNVPNVYAAGDVAEGKNFITGTSEVHAIETTAMEHGRVAAANMAGQSTPYKGSLLMNIVGVAGLDAASFGVWDDDQAEVISQARPDRSAYRKYLFHGNRLTGAIYVGMDEETWTGNDLGMLKGLVQSGNDLGDWKEYLKKNPFDIRKAYLATQSVAKLMPETVLQQPTPSPRG